ncbi:MAG: NAD-dependent epimerase/dehydratase family protein [Myxococcota bacterium]
MNVHAAGAAGAHARARVIGSASAPRGRARRTRHGPATQGGRRAHPGDRRDRHGRQPRVCRARARGPHAPHPGARRREGAARARRTRPRRARARRRTRRRHRSRERRARDGRLRRPPPRGRPAHLRPRRPRAHDRDERRRHAHRARGGHARGLDPLVHVSSLSALWEPGVEVATEDSPVAAPRDPYSRSKADAERVARALQERGAPVVCVYPSAVWGPDNPTLGNQITTIFAMVQWNYYLSVEGGMPIVDARDLAQAIARAMEPGRGARRYMLAGHFLTHDEMRELVSDLRGAALWRVPCPGAALRFAGRVGDWLRRFTPIDPGAVTEESMMLATRGIRGDDAKTLSALGLALRPIRETVEAQMRWMYENGHLSARDVGRLADAARASGATPTT